ncbi:radical SAM protein, partial [Elusimicrobiota bacterium]
MTTDAEFLGAAEERVRDFKELLGAGLVCLDGRFFPSVHYPPITMYPAVTEEALFKTYRVPPDGLFDIYVHIPFCIRHCSFCHYPV